jgi:hypothetical protein
MVGRKIAPEQFAVTLFKIVGDWKIAGEKIDALSFSSNLSPRLSALRDEAQAAHMAGRLDEAERLLAMIAQAEIDALTRLEDHQREVQEEIRLRKRGVAETKAAQAAVAHARLNYREAAVLYGEAAGIRRLKRCRPFVHKRHFGQKPCPPSGIQLEFRCHPQQHSLLLGSRVRSFPASAMFGVN